jgi:hypothetical protein
MQINPKTGLPFKTTPKRRETASRNRIASKRTTHGRAVVLVNNARGRSLKKNISMEVTQEWVEKHLERGTCQLTGIPFSLEPPPEGVTRRWDAPSLDRISKHKHYTEDNTRVILWAVNCALSEYGTETMLPVLKAMVKGIEDAQTKSTTPVSETDYREGEIYPELGSFSTTWAGEDSDDAHHHCGADARKDIDSGTQASSGDSVGCGSGKMGTSFPLESEQDNWQLHPTYGWIER